MAPPGHASDALEEDWLGLCRGASDAVARALERYPTTAERSQTTGRGEGGDLTLVVDRAAEDAIFGELEALGAPVTAVSEERGHVAIAGGGPVHVVIDPIDGSLNAKRGFPSYSVSIAVARGATMADVEIGYVRDLACGDEWWARRGEGAFLGGERLGPLDASATLEVLGIESAMPEVVEAAAARLAMTGARRLRALGSIALTLCQVAAGRLDGMVSLAACRSVDAAAGQLIVTEAGGAAAFPDTADGLLGASLALDMRSRVVAAAGPEPLGRLLRDVCSVAAPDGMRG